MQSLKPFSLLPDLMAPLAVRAYWRSIPVLWKTLIVHGPIAIIIFVLIEVYVAPEYEPSPDTVRYLYSAMFQGFAALVALQVAILGLNYQRLKDSQEAYLSEASDAATSLAISARHSYQDLIDETLNWYNGGFKAKITQVSNLADGVQSMFPKPPAPKTGKHVPDLKQHYGQLRWEMERYEGLVSNLGRFKNSSETFRDLLPAKAILAIVPAFLVIGLSSVALGGIDHIGTSQSIVALFMLLLSAFAIVYAFSFFRAMMRILFGGFWVPGFAETELPEPKEARQVLQKARTVTGWR